mmetsp:Transcript_25564/g.39591  ORF Transcript_25564/g.39591 Transcript_25564/m.39591 type:complete len:302 (-) Transcript_25564:290-1195(-)
MGTFSTLASSWGDCSYDSYDSYCQESAPPSVDGSIMLFDDETSSSSSSCKSYRTTYSSFEDGETFESLACDNRSNEKDGDVDQTHCQHEKNSPLITSTGQVHFTDQLCGRSAMDIESSSSSSQSYILASDTTPTFSAVQNIAEYDETPSTPFNWYESKPYFFSANSSPVPNFDQADNYYLNHIAHQQKKFLARRSDPIMCPPPLAEPKFDELVNPEDEYLYNEATWRMYYRIMRSKMHNIVPNHYSNSPSGKYQVVEEEKSVGDDRTEFINNDVCEIGFSSDNDLSDESSGDDISMFDFEM